MIMTYTKPNQPDPKVLQKQVMKDRTLTFQKSWSEKYPWLHVSMGTDGVLCFHCSKYFKTGKPAQAKSIDQAFVRNGFKNWKKHLKNVPCMRNQRVTTLLLQLLPMKTGQLLHSEQCSQYTAGRKQS